MKYSLDQMHETKDKNKRRNGKTVDAIVAAIGSIMVTEKERIPFVVHSLNDLSYIREEFISLCYNHFDVYPKFDRSKEWGILGYSSTFFFVTLSQWENAYWMYDDINAISDLHWSRIN